MMPRPATASSIQYPTLAEHIDPQVIPPTVNWPTSRPRYSTTKGSIRPAEASARR